MAKKMAGKSNEKNRKQISPERLDDSGLENRDEPQHRNRVKSPWPWWVRRILKAARGMSRVHIFIFIFGVIGALVMAYIFGADGPWSGSMEIGKVEMSPSVGQKYSGGAPDSVIGATVEVNWRNALESGRYDKNVLDEQAIKYTSGGKLLLVIAGHVFDVSSAERMYGEGSGYHSFIGRDCTRAFITGKFDDDGCASDIEDLDDTAISEINKWLGFYFDHDTYDFVGVVPGRYFDKDGSPTVYFKNLIKRMKSAEIEKEKESELEQMFPPCNVEWTAASGSRLWCSSKSGGIDRDWVGYPRQFTEGEKETRCACVEKNLLRDPRVKLYDGCEEMAYECKLKP